MTEDAGCDVAPITDWGHDPKAQEAADNLRGLVGRTLVRIEVVPLGVMFHFSEKAHDNGVVYWAYGGPK